MKKTRVLILSFLLIGLWNIVFADEVYIINAESGAVFECISGRKPKCQPVLLIERPPLKELLKEFTKGESE